jgi:hypothetical protein
MRQPKTQRIYLGHSKRQHVMKRFGSTHTSELEGSTLSLSKDTQGCCGLPGCEKINAEHSFLYIIIMVLALMFLVVLPLICALLDSSTHAIWIFALIFLLGVQLGTCWHFRGKFSGYIVPCLICLGCFYMFGLLRTLKVISWDWSMMCIPLYVFALLVIAFGIHFYCYNKASGKQYKILDDDEEILKW